jgi:hypothetical protein
MAMDAAGAGVEEASGSALSGPFAQVVVETGRRRQDMLAGGAAEARLSFPNGVVVQFPIEIMGTEAGYRALVVVGRLSCFDSTPR